MIIKVNGKEHDFDEPLNITQLIQTMQIKGSMFVIEHNLNIINKDNYDQTYLKDNDQIEIVGFAGGG